MKIAETPEGNRNITSLNDSVRAMLNREGRSPSMNVTETPEGNMNAVSLNDSIRAILKQENLKLWQLADMLGVSEATITRMMRHEVSDEKFDEIVKLINTQRDNATE